MILFKPGDKVIYHGSGTNQNLKMIGCIGTVVTAPQDNGAFQSDTHRYIMTVYIDHGKTRFPRQSSYYCSNWEHYEDEA